MNTGTGIIDIITSALGTILYPLFSIVFVLIDAVQNIFYAFAGIGNSGLTFAGQGVDTTVTNANDGGETTTGVLYYLFQQPVIRNLLLSIMLLALLLIVIFTVMAFIKNTYSPKPKTWTEIVGNALKGLANFIFLPVCCLLGVWGGNILLNAINGATSNGGSAEMSRKLFIACAYNANYFRTGYYKTSDYKNIWDIANSAGGCTVTGDSKEQVTEFTITITNGDDKIEIKVKPDMTAEQYAQIVDQIYSESQISIHWYSSVYGAYSLWQFNYLLLIIGGVFMLYVLGSLAFAMVRRLFILLALFVISPALCAMYPLDEGAVVGQWKKKFISETISAYGAVAGMNIFFSIVPIVDKIRVFTGIGSIVNEIFRIFILVVGLFCVKEIIGLISGYVGGENAYEKGANTMKQAKEAVSKYGGKVAKGATSSAFRIGSRVKQSIQTSKKEEQGKASTFFSALGAGLGATGREIGRHATFGLSESVIDSTKAGQEKGFGGVVDELTKPFRKSGIGKDIDDQIKEEKERAKSSKKEDLMISSVSSLLGQYKTLMDHYTTNNELDSVRFYNDPQVKAIFGQLKGMGYINEATKNLKLAPEQFESTQNVIDANKNLQKANKKEEEFYKYYGFSTKQLLSMERSDVLNAGFTDDDVERARTIMEGVSSARKELQKATSEAMVKTQDAGLQKAFSDLGNKITDLGNATNDNDIQKISQDINDLATKLINSNIDIQTKMNSNIAENINKMTKDLNKGDNKQK